MNDCSKQCTRLVDDVRQELTQKCASLASSIATMSVDFQSIRAAQSRLSDELDIERAKKNTDVADLRADVVAKLTAQQASSLTNQVAETMEKTQPATTRSVQFVATESDQTFDG